MDNEERLVRLGMPYVLAEEVVRQIGGGGSGSGIPEGASILLNASLAIPDGWYTYQTITLGGIDYSIINQGEVPALVMLTPPTATPASVTVGENVLLTNGTYSGFFGGFGVLLQDGVDRTNEIVDGVWSPAQAGPFTWSYTANGANGQQISNTVGGTITEPIDLKAVALLYMDGDTPYTGTETEVTGLNAEGTGAFSMVVQGGTGGFITKVTDGFRFPGTRYFRIQGLSPAQLAGGVMALVEMSVDAASGTQHGLNVGAGQFTLRDASTQYQMSNSTGTPGNTNLGAAVAGQRVTLVAELDADGDLSKVQMLSGSITTATRVMPEFTATEIGIGQGLTGVVYKVALFVKPVGGAFPIAFDDIASGGGAPIPITSITVTDADGQSLALAANVSNTIAPNGTAWRTNYTTPNVRSLQGLQRPDGVVVTHVSAPLLQGYNPSVAATGIMNATVLSNLPLGQMVAYGLVRDGVITDTAAFQFHGAGGQSVYNFNDDPADGDGRTTLYNNRKHYLENLVDQAGSAPVRTPRFYWNQGEADAALARGVYQDAFRKTHTQQRSLIMSTTGQPTPPRLYMWQTGGYCEKKNDHWMVLDQIDAIREWDAILIGPNWQVPVADRNVHPGHVQYMYLSELAVWATTEVEAGRGWNLLPPASVQRIGNSIIIPISIRNDEQLITVAGKYGNYGGDPVNFGIEVFGGGSILTCSVSDGSIILEVTGNVTAVRHAHQRAAGIDYGDFTDADGLAYVAHRSLIRTNLTKDITVFGQSMTLERWVPSFEVLVT